MRVVWVAVSTTTTRQKLKLRSSTRQSERSTSSISDPHVSRIVGCCPVCPVGQTGIAFVKFFLASADKQLVLARAWRTATGSLAIFHRFPGTIPTVLNSELSDCRVPRAAKACLHCMELQRIAAEPLLHSADCIRLMSHASELRDLAS